MILVTGASGFIGCGVLRRLAGMGRHVVGVDLTPGICSGVLRMDVSDAADLSGLIGDARAVIHLAGVASVTASFAAPAAFIAREVGMARRLLHVAQSTNTRVILVSSAATLHQPRRSPYAVAKAEIERLGREARILGGVAVVRPFNVYGPGQRARGTSGAVVPSFVSAARARNPFPVCGNGGQTRDFVHVDDVAEAIVTLVDTVGLSGVWDVGTGEETSVNELVSVIARLGGVAPTVARHAPRPGDVDRSRASIEALAREVGWRATTDLTTGLEALLRSNATSDLARVA